MNWILPPISLNLHKIIVLRIFFPCSVWSPSVDSADCVTTKMSTALFVFAQMFASYWGAYCANNTFNSALRAEQSCLSIITFIFILQHPFSFIKKYEGKYYFFKCKIKGLRITKEKKKHDRKKTFLLRAWLWEQKCHNHLLRKLPHLKRTPEVLHRHVSSNTSSTLSWEKSDVKDAWAASHLPAHLHGGCW